ncbi:hypothetical protein F511_41297 [Dorcoceras hygrometricum]|uniref:Uncharacterized protein n=1 Tax=Dorcoceras hygrometricum TaxID=472368 RepID=A0A2Z7A9G6_9LAMI|nr:hypothetical protein F511_41297 [Dorcoceras hygrometricum]
MKRRRAGESADGLALMTSLVTSYSADGLREQSQESAGSLYIQTQERSDVVECYLEIAIAKRCRLHKLIRQRFALALKIQQMLFAMKIISSRELQCYCISSRLATQTQEKKKQAKCRDSTSHKLYESSRQRFQQKMNSVVSAAKQLTIYEELSKLDVNC